MNTEGLTLFAFKIPCGFPSPADDHIEQKLKLDEHLITHPAATFFVRVSGNSMTGVGIFSGDLLVVDRSLVPINGSVIVAVLDGELTIKSFYREDNKVYLVPANHEYKTIEISDPSNLYCWGVVTYNIHDLRKPQ